MTRTPLTENPVSLGFVEQIEFKDITQLQVVGKGAFGVVYLGKWRDKFVAIKKIESDAERKAFIVEIRQLSRVSHPNIVKLYGSCIEPVCLVMEYAEGGSLYNVLHSFPQVPYTFAHAMSWVYQTACGVAYLHGMQPKPLIHRDLKPPNLLLINGGTILKICDFGTACDKQTYMTNSKGSAAWMAPEVFESNAYTEKCDIFSWAIILWEVLTRRKPFDDVGGPAFRIMWHVHKGNRPPQIADCPKSIERLMNACWDPNPNHRPSMQQIMEVTGRICEVLPGADIPLQYPVPSTSHSQGFEQDNIPVDTESSFDAFNESSTSEDPNDTGDIPSFPYGNHTVKELPSGLTMGTLGKTLATTLPPLPGLTIEIAKNAWDDAVLDGEDLVMNRPDKLAIGQPNRQASDVPTRPQESSHFPDSEISQAAGPFYLPNQGIDNFKPQPPPKPVRPPTLNFLPRTEQSKTGPALQTKELKVPTGHQRSASDGSDKIFINNTPRNSGGSGNEFGKESAGGGNDSLYENAYLMLEPEFQPISPATDIPESLRIFEEHKKLAKDYLQTRTEIECLLQAKKELEQQLREQEKYGPFGGQRDSQRILKEWRELKSENESLSLYHRNLKKQLEIIKSRRTAGTSNNTAGTQEFEPEPGWVMVSRKDDNNDAPPVESEK